MGHIFQGLLWIAVSFLQLAVVGCSDDSSVDSGQADSKSGVSDSAVDVRDSSQLPQVEQVPLKIRVPQKERPQSYPAIEGQAEVLEEIKIDWRALRSAGLVGEELIEAKQQWALAALEQLGGSKELSELLAFLDQRGESDLKEWIIQEGVLEAFSGEQAEGMRQWLRSLGPEDKKMAVRLGFSAGRGLMGNEEGLKGYLATFEDVNIQSAILSGYCCEYAGEHPEQAVSKFMSLRPGGVDASGVMFVMSELPPDTDFIAAGSGIPEDGKTLAKNARKAMLENWAGVDAIEAANYVMANTSKVHADQLGVVLDRWLVADEEAAANWMASLQPGEHRDEAYIAEARVFAKSDIARAWEAAGQVADVDRRIKAATPVYEVWAGRDPHGAKVAWELMFNQP